MAIVFILALLVDSACAAACIPAEFRGPAEHCSSDHRDAPERGCDLHGHLKPVVKDRGFIATVAARDTLPPFETTSEIHPIESIGVALGREAPRHVPPLFQRSTVLRI